MAVIRQVPNGPIEPLLPLELATSATATTKLFGTLNGIYNAEVTHWRPLEPIGNIPRAKAEERIAAVNNIWMVA